MKKVCYKFITLYECYFTIPFVVRLLGIRIIVKLKQTYVYKCTSMTLLCPLYCSFEDTEK